MAKREREDEELEQVLQGNDPQELGAFLMNSIRDGDFHRVKMLLPHVKIDVSYLEEVDDNIKMFKLLLNSPELDVNNISSESSFTFLGNMIINFNYSEFYAEKIRLTLKHPDINVNAINAKSEEYPKTALQLALDLYFNDYSQGVLHLIDLLIRHPKMDVNARYRNYPSALHFAVGENLYLVVELLLKHRYINVNAKTINDLTPLMMGFEFNSLESVTALLRHPNIDVNARDDSGKSVLFNYKSNIDYKLFIMLLRHPKIDVNVQGPNGITLLHILSMTRNSELAYTAVADLLSIHPNINPNLRLTVPTGGTPLQFALKNDNFTIAERITSLRQIDYNTIENNALATTFILLVRLKNDYFVKKALRHPSTNVNAQNINGKTALMFALEENYRRAVIEILKHPDTDVFLVSNDGRTALEYCGDDLMCKAIIFRRMIWDRKYSRLGRDVSKMIALHRMRDHLCREMSTEANRADLLVLAELLGVPPGLWQNATKAELCRNVADIIAIGGAYDEEAFATELQKRPEKQRRMQVRTQSMMESFREGLAAFNIVETGGKTLNQLMLELNRLF